MSKRKRGSFQSDDELPNTDFGLGATLAYLKGEDTAIPGTTASNDEEGWTVVGSKDAKKRSRKQTREKDRRHSDGKLASRDRRQEAASKRVRRRTRSPSRSRSIDSPSDNEEQAVSGPEDVTAKSSLPFGGNPFAPKNGELVEHGLQSSNPFSAPGNTAEQDNETSEEVAKRREDRRKARKLARNYPVIKHSYNARLRGMTRISDLQALTLYILADGTAPQWVAVENRSSIRKVVVLMVPGLEMDMFDGKLSLESDAADENDRPKRMVIKRDDYHPTALKHDKLPDSLKPLCDVFPHIWPIQGPSESRGKNYTKLHSPMHAILTSLIPKSQEEKQLKKSGSHKGPLPQSAKHWENKRTPITEYLCGLAEQQENEYVVHPAWFTTEEAKEASRQRRKDTHSAAEDGWVDTRVPRLEEGDVPEADIEQGSVTAGRRVLAVDCEMCKDENDISVLTRISLIDWDGTVVMDKLVKPDTPIKDYVTQWSGITEEMLRDVTTTLADIQKELLDILTPHTILIGHSLNADLNAMKLTHPFLVDTGILFPHIKGPPFKQSLKWLAQKFLKKDIQKGTEGHDSVEDAKTCLSLVQQKCERGPKWGTGETNMESIFKRIERALRPKSSGEYRGGAAVDWGNPNQGPGAQAKVAIGCNSDAEVVAGIKHALSGLAVGKNGTTEQIDFAFARLRELELVRGWWDDGRASADSKARRQAALARLGLPPDWNAEITDEALGKEVAKTVDNIVDIYNALPPCTAFIVYSGTGDPREVRRLRQLHDKNKEEYRTKKWDEVTEWGREEDEMLSRAVKKARNGVGFMVVK